jgi:hypothetical protein
MASSAMATSELFRGHMEALQPRYTELLGDLGTAYWKSSKWYLKS